jgi:hypothetical protein
MGTQVVGESNSVEYSTPLKIVKPLINEFGLTKDVCASSLNHKLPNYWTIMSENQLLNGYANSIGYNSKILAKAGN